MTDRRTLGWTAALSALLFAVIFLVPISTRNAQGQFRHETTARVWSRALDRLPPEAPGLLSGPLLTILLLASVVLFAWVIVAILRLPR